MTRIVFDSNGRPHWFKVPQSGAFMHSLPDLERARADQDTTPPFTQEDKDWFRKPLDWGPECH